MSGTTNNSPVAIAIMAGGKSRRMGRDKAEIEHDGKTLLDRMIDEALAVSDTVAVVGRTGSRQDVTWLEDDQPGLGPLGGLKTALAHLDRPTLLVACDMPLLDAAALGWLIDRFHERTDGVSPSEKNLRHLPRPRRPQSAALAKHGLATTRDGQLEPLFSVYTPAALALVEQRIAAGELSARGLIKKGDFACAEAPDEVAQKLVNVNTPEDLEAID